MRGEHPEVFLGWRPRSGSSPHARGAPSKFVDDDGKDGIIPACAGSTLWRGMTKLKRWDHPRMRGEHS